MLAVRVLPLTCTCDRQVSGPSPLDASTAVDDLWTPCSGGDAGAVAMTWMDVEGSKLLPPLPTLNDFLRSIESTKPSVNHEDVAKQVSWTHEFGQEG